MGSPTTIKLEAIAQAVVLLATANQQNPREIFGRTTDMSLLAKAFEKSSNPQHREAATTIQTWNEIPEKKQREYASLFRAWKSQF